MKRILAAIAVTGLLGSVGAATAADLSPRSYTKAAPVDPGYNWSGFYLGLNAGYGTGNAPTALNLNPANWPSLCRESIIRCRRRCARKASSAVARPASTFSPEAS